MPAKSQAPSAPSPYLTKDEAAKYCRCSPRTLDRDTDIPRIKRFGRVLFHIKSLDAAMMARESAK
jgi:hypothetical protein